jgi:phage gp29-like protein
LAAAPLTDAWREYVVAGITPERLASIFREADQGDIRRQAELFEQILEKDAHLLGETGKRENAILNEEFQVRPASDSARDHSVAEFVDDFFQDQDDWPDVQVAMQEAVGRGYSGMEIHWDVSSGQAVPSSFESLEHKRFLFQDATGIVSKTPRLITDTDPMGIDIPSWKVLMHRYGGKSGSPTRSGIYRVAAWMFLFKNYAIKDWVIFAEVYGMPLRIGKYAPGATEADKDALIQAISSLGTDAAGIISKSTEIEFVETASGTTSADLYKLLASFCNAEMSKAILGQTLTAEVGDKGSYAASKTHNEVRLDLIRADARALAATIRQQLIRPLVGFNFGWDTALPGFGPVYDEDEDLQEKALWMMRLLDRGVKMPVKWVREQFKVPDPEPGEETVGELLTERVAAKRKAIDTIIAAGTASADPTPIEPLADRMSVEAAPAIEAMLTRIRALVETAPSLEALRDALLESFSDLPSDELAKVMQAGFAVAALAGRNDVAEDSDA